MKIITDKDWQDLTDAQKAATVIEYVERQKAAGVPRDQIKLPCGEYMIARGFDDAHNATEYEPVFDNYPGEWLWSDEARRVHPGLGVKATGRAARREYKWR